MKKYAVLLVALLAVLLSACASVEAQTGPKKPVLYIYSCLDEAATDRMASAFAASHTNADVKRVDVGKQELLARLEAESADPIADVVLGLSAEEAAAHPEWFAPYEPKNASEDIVYADDGSWFGISYAPVVLLYDRAAISDASALASWADLLDSSLKGKIAVASPESSDVSLLALCAMYRFAGSDADGEAFLTELASSVLQYPGMAEALRSVSDGECAVAVTSEAMAQVYAKSDRFGIIYPEGGCALPLTAALVNGSDVAALARQFLDYASSRECQQMLYSECGLRPARGDVSTSLTPVTKLAVCDLTPDWAAENSAHVAELWNGHFE